MSLTLGKHIYLLYVKQVVSVSTKSKLFVINEEPFCISLIFKFTFYCCCFCSVLVEKYCAYVQILENANPVHIFSQLSLTHMIVLETVSGLFLRYSKRKYT